MKKILFISHYAGRTGAPLMLLHLLQWLKSHSDLSFEILLREDGLLRADFEAIAPVHIHPAGNPPKPRLGAGIAKRLGFDLQGREVGRLIARLQKTGIGLIYANTITNGDLLEELAPLGCPVITHVHELDYWIQQSGPDNLEKVKRHTTHYIAASQAVQENLTAHYGIPEAAIEVVHSFIPVPESLPGPAVAAGIRLALHIPAEAFVVLGSGHETWRKGKDLFVQLAARVGERLNGRPAHFLWVGGWQNREHERNILHDVSRLGLSGRVHFTGEVPNPLDYFAASDVFAMVSREDPFPLVCLEAALLGKPVLCFADAGGMPEFVEEDAGFIVPYLNLGVLAERITTLAGDQTLSNSLGEQAARKVRDRYGLEAGAESIGKIIDSSLQRPS